MEMQTQGRGFLQEQAPDMEQMQGQPQETPVSAGQQQMLPPEKQQLLEKAFQVGKNIIYDKEIFGAIVKEMDSGEPAQSLAEAIVMVLGTIEKDQSIGQLPFDIAMGAGIALLGDLADALMQTGRGPFDANTIQTALQYGTQLYLQLNGSRVNPQELQAQVAQLQQFLGGGQ